VIGKTISHYKILEKLGEGGMGEVYLADDLKLDRQVAIKFLPEHLTKDKENVERFEREAKAAAALNHPNIVTIYEIAEENDQTFIVMEYVDGDSLRTKIDKGVSDIDEVLDITKQICEGLEKAHLADIVHRDIKPENILVDNDGRVKILDFGLAKLKGVSKLTKETSTLGTIHYMSPEQLQGKEIDHRSDIWSLGVVLYQMLTREFPFKGEFEQAIVYSIINEEPQPVRTMNRDIPLELEQIINRALEKDPKSRCSSSAEMLKDLERQYKSAAPGARFSAPQSLWKSIRKTSVALPLIVAIIAIGLFAAWFFNRSAKIQWAKETAIPEVERLANEFLGSSNYVKAYRIAQKAEQYIPDNLKLIELLSKCAANINIQTIPPGAKVYNKQYTSQTSKWTFLGISPLKNCRMPKGYFLWKVEKEGYATSMLVSQNYQLAFEGGLFNPLDIEIELDEKGIVPPRMVTIRRRGKLDDFYIDKYEVTNSQFKEFVEQGGYRKQEYWKYPFVLEGRIILWQQAMAEFRDASGQPGPSTWQGGDYADGEEDYPVSGISWHEAAAYAEFVDKSLPTVFHWQTARGTALVELLHGFPALIIPLSNFGSKGPAAVGSHPGISSYGVYDMAGNVREWCWNESPQGRCIRGGAWNDAVYMFGNVSQASPFDRSSKNGFRCVRYIDAEKIPKEVFQPFDYDRHYRNYYDEERVSNEIFAIYKDQFSYDEMELNPQLKRGAPSKNWLKEKITFDAAYGNERMIAYLYLPKKSEAPYQTVIYFPGAHAVYTATSEKLENTPEFEYFLSFIIKSGRAVVYPVYKTTYERQYNMIPWRLKESHQFTAVQIMLVKDFKRTVDYLRTRPEINGEKLAYYGMSWGGIMAALIPAVEDRLKASISVVGGLYPGSYGRSRPEVDLINYVSRVKIPTLMLNGRYDMELPLETAVEPMYKLLGTPEKDKELTLYDTDHFIPRNQLIRETLSWLDRYLGSVN
jgi:serine/threonine protein kinase/formylglycine-generating enzyme required for sulfatase activity/dienelactone hydrolase